MSPFAQFFACVVLIIGGVSGGVYHIHQTSDSVVAVTCAEKTTEAFESYATNVVSFNVVEGSIDRVSPNFFLYDYRYTVYLPHNHQYIKKTLKNLECWTDEEAYYRYKELKVIM